MKAASPKLLILTGPVHSGKTSFLRTLAADARRRGLPAAGYLSAAVFDGDDRAGYDLEILPEGASYPFLRKEGESGWPRVGPYVVVPDTLERAIRTIRSSAGAHLFIVDELGPLELAGEGVWPALEGVFARPPAVLVLTIRDSLVGPFRGRIPGGRSARVLDVVRSISTGTVLGLAPVPPPADLTGSGVDDIRKPLSGDERVMTGADPESRGTILRLFRSVGRASLLADMQDSHSGNMSVKFLDGSGREFMAITATGSQKGDLEPGDIRFIPAGETDYDKYGASSETNTHAGILGLPGVRATIHVHAKDLTIMTLDDSPKPSSPGPFVPVDPLGFHHLGGLVPVLWVSEPTRSAELAAACLSALADHPAVVIQTHGVFTRARTLAEAFFLAHIANASGTVVRTAARLGADLGGLRSRLGKDPDRQFDGRPEPYCFEPADRCDFPEEDGLRREFVKTGARIFESGISPFHTGSMSVRGEGEMFYAPKASMPREVGGPLLRLPLKPGPSDPAELGRHKAIYAGSDFRAILHCYVLQAEGQALAVRPGPDEPYGRIIPIDTEGGYLYPVVPVVPPRTDDRTLIRLLQEHKMIAVRGGGVWAAGRRSLSEALHHSSSLREICLYRLGAAERGLDLRRMESVCWKRR